jgi:DNA-binding response OmpR family regulator
MADNILIVDDNPHVLKLLKISLEKAGYNVTTAENGDEGLERTNEIQPDLIISDVMMPQTDGIEFCWMIRENSSIPMVPFIFLTSLEDRDMEIRGFRAGADEYLIKPVDRKVLLEKVTTLLNRAKRVKSMDMDESAQIKGFEGNLADLSIVEVIQLLNMNKRSGMLDVLGNQGGKIIFQNGEMVFAESKDSVGVNAINKIVGVREGMFRFEPRIPDIESNITGSTMNILLEALRLLDEANIKKDPD